MKVVVEVVTTNWRRSWICLEDLPDIEGKSLDSTISSSKSNQGPSLNLEGCIQVPGIKDTNPGETLSILNVLPLESQEMTSLVIAIEQH